MPDTRSTIYGIFLGDRLSGTPRPGAREKPSRDSSFLLHSEFVTERRSSRQRLPVHFHAENIEYRACTLFA
jgi:hypothetical protein